jgi:hypothetical protein
MRGVAVEIGDLFLEEMDNNMLTGVPALYL